MLASTACAPSALPARCAASGGGGGADWKQRWVRPGGRQKNGRRTCRGQPSIRCELLDRRDYGNGEGGGGVGGRRRSEGAVGGGGRLGSLQPKPQGLYLPGQHSSSPLPPLLTPLLTRRGTLLGSAAVAAAASADLILPAPATAFIDLPSRLHNRYFLVRHGESLLDTR